MKGKLIWVRMLLDIQGQLSCLLFLSSHIVLSGQFGQRGIFFPLPSVLPCVPVYLGRKGVVQGLLGCSILGCEWDVITARFWSP